MPIDGYRAFPYRGFGGGLNLRDGPDVVSEEQAIDALNVMFTTRGSVAARSGYNKFTQLEGTNRYDSLEAFYKVDGTKQLIAGAGNRLEAITAAGAVLASSTLPTANPHYFERFGGPTAEHLYIANGTDTVRRWTGSVFETPVYTGTTPNGKFLALDATSNRLINARFSGAAAGNNPSTMRFSAEGDPLSFGATHYHDFAPGDGEEIMRAVSWRDQTFIFKKSRFWVVYGFQPDDEGDPDPQIRPVDGGVGLVASNAIAVAEQGIYFLSDSGIYFTDGKTPARVSELVEPVFLGGASVYWQGGELNTNSLAQCSMEYHDERLWFSFPSGVAAVNDKQLVFDPHEKWWALTNFPAGPMTNFKVGDDKELVFGYSSGTKDIGRYKDGTYTADNMGRRETNLVTNPSFEVDLTGWTNLLLNPPTSQTRVADAGGVGSWANEVVCPATINTGTTYSGGLALTVGVTYTASIRLKKMSGADNLKISVAENFGAFREFIIAGPSLGPAGWTEYRAEFTALATGDHVLIVQSTSAAAVTFRVDAALVAAGTDTETYFDGANGGTWTGVAHASTSIRFTSAVDGSAIVSRWQGGWFNYGTPLVKTIREAKISGTGLVTVDYFRDYRQTGQTTQQRELSPPVGTYDSGLLYDAVGLRYGPGGVVQAKPLRKATRGEAFSVRFSNSTIHRSFKVHRLTTHIREARVPSVVKVN